LFTVTDQEPLSRSSVFSSIAVERRQNHAGVRLPSKPTDKKCASGRHSASQICQKLRCPVTRKTRAFPRKKKFFRRVLTIGAYVLEILDVRRESINWEICLPRFRCLCSSLNKKKSELFWYVK
jgi:hypothetical protein